MARLATKLTGTTSMSVVWNTKYGTRRVKQNPPSVPEAILAARGLSDDRAQQIEFACMLTGLSAEEIREEMIKTDPAPNVRPTLTVSVAGRNGQSRAVVVERKVSRRRAV